MKIIKKYYIYGLIFIFFLLWNLIISPLNLDEVWNYGFTRNIFLGEIPYKDFNMVITPLFPLILSIPMHIFGDNMLFFHIENALLITITFYFIIQLLGNKTWYIIPFLLWPLNISYPSYNLLALSLVILIIYLDDKEYNDIIIGILLGLLFLTKQSVGIVLLLSVFLYYKQKDKLLKRLISFLIPILVFIIYLLITNSFNEMINYCFLGLFDFNNKNSNYLSIGLFLTIVFIILTIFLYKKDKNKDYIYLLLFSSMTIPIFDYYHFNMFFLLFLIVFFKNNKELDKYYGVGEILLGLVLLTNINIDINSNYPNKINKFEYRYLSKEYIKVTNEIEKELNKYNKIMIVGPNSYYHKIINNKKINELDLINTGNWGYQGTKKLLNKVKEIEKETIFFVDKNEIGSNKQTDQELIQYIRKNGIMIKNTKYYEIYDFQ